MAWAVFEHGTAFFTTPTQMLPIDSTFEAIAEAARAALRTLGPVTVGTESADFSAIRMSSWYPEEPLWMVSFATPDIATIVSNDGSDLTAGLDGRQRRQQDHDEQKLVIVRRFDGTTRSLTGT